MTSQLQLTNVINVSVSSSPVGANAYNTSNLAFFTGETPNGSFPSSQGYQIYLDASDVATDWGSSSITYQAALAVFSQKPNILAGGGYFVVIPLLSMETIDAAITRTQSLVQYFGILAGVIESQANMLAAGAVVQALNKIAFFVQKTSASIAVGGSLDLLRSGSLTQTRGLYYGSTDDLSAVLYAAAYAGRALSVNFSGSLTTITMNLKQLATIQPDPTLTQALYVLAKAAGADVYASLQGTPGVLCSGANQYFDQVYNAQWAAGAIQIAGFNYLQSAGTKIPQTEQGMSGLKGAYRAVCQQAVANGYLAPGTWTSPTTFGNQQDLLDNVAQIGYYIYSAPIATQLPTDRTARVAPLVQIAFKEAGAIQSSSVIININP